MSDTALLTVTKWLMSGSMSNGYVALSFFLFPSLLLQFAVYETIKRILVRRKGKKAHNLRGLVPFLLSHTRILLVPHAYPACSARVSCLRRVSC